MKRFGGRKAITLKLLIFYTSLNQFLIMGARHGGRPRKKPEVGRSNGPLDAARKRLWRDIYVRFGVNTSQALKIKHNAGKYIAAHGEVPALEQILSKREQATVRGQKRREQSAAKKREAAQAKKKPAKKELAKRKRKRRKRAKAKPAERARPPKMKRRRKRRKPRQVSIMPKADPIPGVRPGLWPQERMDLMLHAYNSLGVFWKRGWELDAQIVEIIPASERARFRAEVRAFGNRYGIWPSLRIIAEKDPKLMAAFEDGIRKRREAGVQNIAVKEPKPERARTKKIRKVSVRDPYRGSPFRFRDSKVKARVLSNYGSMSVFREQYRKLHRAIARLYPFGSKENARKRAIVLSEARKYINEHGKMPSIDAVNKLAAEWL